MKGTYITERRSLKMKKEYTTPDVQSIYFEFENILTLSNEVEDELPDMLPED